MRPGLILEGVTGSGKSEILKLLRGSVRCSHLLGVGRIFFENETFGELLETLADVSRSDVDRCSRLRRVMQALAAGKMKDQEQFGFLLERFHPSYFALMPQWKLYANIDQALERMGCRLVLLTYAPELAEERALPAKPGDGENREDGLLAYYGSKENALKAVRASIQGRLDFLRYTGLPCKVIDTAPKDWNAHAREVLDYWEADSA